MATVTIGYGKTNDWASHGALVNLKATNEQTYGDGKAWLMLSETGVTATQAFDNLTGWTESSGAGCDSHRPCGTAPHVCQRGK